MISADQREARRKWVGASDVAAILGFDEFRTANDIWASKVHDLDDLKKSAAEYGDDLEAIALDRAERLFGVTLIRSLDTMHVLGTHLAANPDAAIKSTSTTAYNVGGLFIPVQAKSTGITGPPWGRWGAPWTDEVAPSVCAQVQAEMMAFDGVNHCRTPKAYVTALIGGRGHVMYEIPRDDDQCALILTAVADFWKSVVDKVEPPLEMPFSGETLGRIVREPESVAAIELERFACDMTAVDELLELARKCDDPVSFYKVAGPVTSLLDKLREDAKDRVLTALGTAEIGECPGWRVTYKPRSRTKVDLDILRARGGEKLYEACVTTTHSRAINIQKAKEA